MDKKSKILVAAFALLIVLSIGYTFYKIIIKRDYLVSMETDCNPETEQCFIYECDPEVDGESCPEDLEERISYYKIIKKNAGKVPDCDPEAGDCDPVKCEEGEPDCEETLCDPENLGPDEQCSDPETYREEQAQEESEDEECVDEEDCSSDEESSIDNQSKEDDELIEESTDNSEEQIDGDAVDGPVQDN